MTDLRKAAEQALEFCEDIGGLGGPYPYVDGTAIVGDSRKVLQALRQALAQPDEVLAEREACAKLCEDICLKYSKADDYAERVASQWCAEAIRARSEKRPVKSYCGGKPNYCTPEQGNNSPNYPITESNTPLDKIVELAIQGHASTRDAIRWAMQQEREAIITWLVEDGFFIKDGTLSEQVREKLHHSIYFDVNRRKTPEVTPEVTGDVGACVTCGAPKGEWLVDAVNTSQERVDETAKREHEPVAWIYGRPAYYEPPKREWVGLTDEEMSELANKYKHIETGWRHDMDLIAEVEAKLKEKNT